MCPLRAGHESRAIAASLGLLFWASRKTLGGFSKIVNYRINTKLRESKANSQLRAGIHSYFLEPGAELSLCAAEKRLLSFAEELQWSRVNGELNIESSDGG